MLQLFVPLQKVVQNRKVVQLGSIVMANTNLKEAKAVVAHFFVYEFIAMRIV